MSLLETPPDDHNRGASGKIAGGPQFRKSPHHNPLLLQRRRFPVPEFFSGTWEKPKTYTSKWKHTNPPFFLVNFLFYWIVLDKRGDFRLRSRQEAHREPISCHFGHPRWKTSLQHPHVGPHDHVPVHDMALRGKPHKPIRFYAIFARR